MSMPHAEKTSRRARHDDLANAELCSELDRMHPAAAAERHQCEIARVVAPVDRDELQRVDHVVVGDPDHAARRFRPPDVEPPRDEVESRGDGLHVGVELTAAEVVRIDAPEREVGVGRRGLGAPARVRGRAGNRAGRLRSDVKLPEVVDPGDAAAAAADLDQIDDRHHDRIAGGLPAAFDPVVGHDLHTPSLDEGALGGRAADVQREHVRVADQPSELGGAEDAARRARLDHRDRDLLRLLDGVDAAVRLHDVELAAEARVSGAGRETAEVALGDRLHVRGQDGRVRSLVLPPLAGDLVRGDGRDIRPELAYADGAPPARRVGST